MKPLEINPPRTREIKGLKDDGHVIIECSACGAPLVDCWITKKKFDIQTKIIADCPHCGDKSFEQTIGGGFHLGITDYTVLVDQTINDDNNQIYIETAKGTKLWPDK